MKRVSALVRHGSRWAWHAAIAASALIIFGGIGLIGAFFLARGHW